MSTLFDVAPEPTAALPDLQGSEKQIAWAAVIRAGKLKHCEAHMRQWRLLIDRLRGSGRAEAAARETAAYTDTLDRLGVLEQQASAGWWIDRRDNDARELLLELPARPGNSYGSER